MDEITVKEKLDYLKAHKTVYPAVKNLIDSIIDDVRTIGILKQKGELIDK